MFERCRSSITVLEDNLRPLAASPQAFRALYARRRPRCRTANFTLSTAGKTAEENAQEIADRLGLVRTPAVFSVGVLKMWRVPPASAGCGYEGRTGNAALKAPLYPYAFDSQAAIKQAARMRHLEAQPLRTGRTHRLPREEHRNVAPRPRSTCHSVKRRRFPSWSRVSDRQRRETSRRARPCQEKSSNTLAGSPVSADENGDGRY